MKVIFGLRLKKVLGFSEKKIALIWSFSLIRLPFFQPMTEKFFKALFFPNSCGRKWSIGGQLFWPIWGVRGLPLSALLFTTKDSLKNGHYHKYLTYLDFWS